MKSNDIYKWEPINKIPKHLYLDSIVDNDSGLTITGSQTDISDSLYLQFKSVIFYQSTDETNTLKRLDSFPLLSSEWPLFICKESTYIDWLIDQSHEIVVKEGLCHYIITHGNGILDIIGYQTPEVKWIFDA